MGTRTMIPQGPIHQTPGSNMGPHLTAQSVDGTMWHVPYYGQTTLDMYQPPTFDPRPQWNNIAQNNMGYLYDPGSTPG